MSIPANIRQMAGVEMRIPTNISQMSNDAHALFVVEQMCGNIAAGKQENRDYVVAIFNQIPGVAPGAIIPVSAFGGGEVDRLLAAGFIRHLDSAESWWLNTAFALSK